MDITSTWVQVIIWLLAGLLMFLFLKRRKARRTQR
jgi:LPXTG-motif cell wall-anchored protein